MLLTHDQFLEAIQFGLTEKSYVDPLEGIRLCDYAIAHMVKGYFEEHFGMVFEKNPKITREPSRHCFCVEADYHLQFMEKRGAIIKDWGTYKGRILIPDASAFIKVR